MTYQTLALHIENHIATVTFNRPDKANALNKLAWNELQSVFEDLDTNPAARVVVLQGEGKHFCAGIDLELLMSIRQETTDDCRNTDQAELFGDCRENKVAMSKWNIAPLASACTNACSRDAAI